MRLLNLRKNWLPRVRVRVTLRLVVYRQSGHFDDKPLETPLSREDECRLQLLLVLASTVILRFETHGTHEHILLPQIRDSPNPEGQVLVFISPRNMLAQLYPQTLGSLLVNSYCSQGYGGSIRTLLHTGWLEVHVTVYFPFTTEWVFDKIRTTQKTPHQIVLPLLRVYSSKAETCLRGRCLATLWYIELWSHKPPFIFKKGK
jgi:hypothetical protein